MEDIMCLSHLLMFITLQSMLDVSVTFISSPICNLLPGTWRIKKEI